MGKFFLGTLAGAIGVIVLEVLAVFFLYQFMLKPMSESMFEGAQPPPLPVQGDTLVSGAIHLRDLNNNEIEVALGAGEVLVVNMWATWCPPCVAEMPSLARLAEHTADMPVRVVCVSDEPIEKLQSWVADKDYQAPVYTLESMPMTMGEQGIPETWIIDAHGVVQFKHVGMADWGHQSVIDYLLSLHEDNGAPAVIAPALPEADNSPEAP